MTENLYNLRREQRRAERMEQTANQMMRQAVIEGRHYQTFPLRAAMRSAHTLARVYMDLAIQEQSNGKAVQ